jgi:hypothetical protein
LTEYERDEREYKRRLNAQNRLERREKLLEKQLKEQQEKLEQNKMAIQMHADEKKEREKRMEVYK